MRRNLFWLSDEQWGRIEPHLPTDVRGVERADDRRVISGIVHVLKSGCRWCDCPPEYGPPTTIYNRFVRWARRGVWENLFRELAGNGRSTDTQMMNSTITPEVFGEVPTKRSKTENENRWRRVSAIPKPTGTVDQTDLIGLSGEISALMSGYCDAIGACKSIPVLSVLPLPKLYFQLLLWIISFELCFLLVPIDLCLYLARHLFGRPRFLLGRSVYAYLRSVWDGEIPAFKILRMRYLTRLLLFYRAQAKINALHSVFNRRHLNLLFADPPNDAAVSEAEKFQKSFDLFQKITTDSYQIGVLAIGGPFVALLTITVRRAFFPSRVSYGVILVGPNCLFHRLALWVDSSLSSP